MIVNRCALSLLFACVLGFGELKAQNCYSFTETTGVCYPPGTENVYCRGKCDDMGINCLSGVEQQIQVDTTSTWDDVTHNPNNETGYRSNGGYVLYCAVEADCTCVPGGAGMPGFDCVANLGTTERDPVTVILLDINDPCFPE